MSDRDNQNPAILSENEQTPDEINEFMVSHNVGAKYKCLLKKKAANGGDPGVLDYFENEHPDAVTVPKLYGPGKFYWCFSYGVDDVNGKQKATMREFSMTFPEYPWRGIHEKYLLEKSRIDKAEATRTLEKTLTEAQLSAAERGIAPGSASAQSDPMENLTATMDLLKKLGVPIGGGGGKIDWAAIVAAAGVVTPLVLAFLASGKAEKAKLEERIQSSQNDMNKLLFGLIAQGGANGESKHMTRIMDMTFGALQKVNDFAQIMKPEEKRDWMDRICDGVEKALPQLLELAKMSTEARQKSFIYQAANASPEIKAVRGDVEMQIQITQKLDKQYGFQTANEILKSMGFERSGTLADSFKTYPSPGYGPDGNKVPEEPAT